MPSPERARPGRRVPGRTYATWLLSYGVPRGFFLAAARRGDPLARLETDRALQLDPYETYDAFRSGPAVVSGPVAWCTTSHAAVTHILRSDDFSVGGGREELPGPMSRMLARVQDPWAGTPVEPPSMLATDPPDHGRYRRLVSRAFTARAVSGLEDRIGEVAERLLDDLEREAPGRVDLVERYAALLPVAVIADMLGVPDEMHERLLEWGNGAAMTLDPVLRWGDFKRADRDMRQLHRWFAEHVDHLRDHPGDDLISRLTFAQDSADEPLTDLELRATGLLVLGAGFETTVNLIGNAIRLLDTYPQQRAALLEDPDLWGNAVEEVLRYDSPVQLTMRLSVRETDVLGTAVPAGIPVLTILGGANRDPAVFEDPHTFDVRRSNAAAHVAFSSGAHYCLGASLARREAEVGLRALYARFPDLAVVGTPERRDTRVLRGYENLPVALGRPRAGMRHSGPHGQAGRLRTPRSRGA